MVGADADWVDEGDWAEAQKWAQKIVDSGDASAQKLLDAARAQKLDPHCAGDRAAGQGAGATQC